MLLLIFRHHLRGMALTPSAATLLTAAAALLTAALLAAALSNTLRATPLLTTTLLAGSLIGCRVHAGATTISLCAGGVAVAAHGRAGPVAPERAGAIVGTSLMLISRGPTDRVLNTSHATDRVLGTAVAADQTV